MANNFKLNINEYLQQCNLKDVISFNSEKWISVSKIKDVVRQSFDTYRTTLDKNISSTSSIGHNFTWFNQGENCEILRAGSKGWEKGKLRINVTLEFIPDETEENKSPLDDVRQEIDRGDL